ncbi:MAG: hypothetical protein ACYS8Y_10730 [Planctomycetota bacterium]|jgi:folylpolyglutamate synthase/dihydropteroate synthase
MRLAKSAVGKEDLICITGSFYLIGQAKEQFQTNSKLYNKLGAMSAFAKK